MSQNLLFLLLGLGAGAVYAMLALGLVLEYRAGGVINFAHGAMAMFMAYVYVFLRQDGDLVLPWVGLPHKFSLQDGDVGAVPALLICVVYAALLGLVVYGLIFRQLRRSPPLAKVGASVGLMLGLTSIATLNFGTATVSAPPLFTTGSVELAGLAVPTDRLYLTAIAVVMAAALALLFRSTRFGLATRAAAETEKGTALLGISPDRVAAANWMLGTLLAAVAGILILPITNLDPNSFTLFVIPVLACALVGRFSSFGVTTAAGLVLGMVQSLLVQLQTNWIWLPQGGLGQGVPFIVIAIVMVVFARRLPIRGGIHGLQNPSLGHPTRPLRAAVATFGIGLVALVLLHGSYRTGLISSMITTCLCLSVVVLTGYMGQVSLAQMSFAGIGGFMLSHLADGWGVPFPLSLLCAGVVAAAVGVIIGIPALRIRGVHLAVVTLAGAAAMDAMLFNSAWFGGGFQGLTVSSPKLFGRDLGISGSSAHDYPRLVFGVLVLVIVIAVGLMVARLRTAPLGRMFIAVRSNENAAIAVGIDVARTKLLAFAISAFIAGVGGGLLAYQQTTLAPASFTVLTSLSLLAITYVAGIGRISGAVVAGLMLAPAGLLVTAIGKVVEVGQYQSLVAGIGLIAMAVAHPDGLTSTETGRKGLGEHFVRLRRRAQRHKVDPLLEQSGASPAKDDIDRRARPSHEGIAHDRRAPCPGGAGDRPDLA
jgi:ABC-type branched-subunit amino acid transport system permease subunit